MADQDDDNTIPVAQEHSDDGVIHVVMGIPVQSAEQAHKITRLLRISFAWMIMVTIDHSAAIHYSQMHAKDLHTCRQVNAAANGQRTSTSDYDTYRFFVIIGYVLSWLVALGIPCIGYSGAKRRLRGHINVFRIFGGCFGGMSVFVTIDNFMHAARARYYTEAYYHTIHPACARLAIDAEVTYSIFTVISLGLTITQVLAAVFANTVYYDYEFWENRAIHGRVGVAPVLSVEDVTDVEAQTTRVPFARIELDRQVPHLREAKIEEEVKAAEEEDMSTHIPMAKVVSVGNRGSIRGS